MCVKLLSWFSRILDLYSIAANDANCSPQYLNVEAAVHATLMSIIPVSLDCFTFAMWNSLRHGLCGIHYMLVSLSRVSCASGRFAPRFVRVAICVVFINSAANS